MGKTRRQSTCVRFVAVAATLGAAVACAVQANVTRVGTRTYRVECKDSLAVCLVPVQELCRENGYDIVEGTELRTHVGTAPPEGYESVAANATVRCRQAVPLFGGDPNRPAAVAASAAPTPQPAVPAPVVPTVAAPSAPASPAPVESSGPAVPVAPAPPLEPVPPPSDGGAR